MNDKQNLSPVISELKINNLESFKKSVDLLLAKRQYLITKVLPEFQEGLDYYVIKGRKSLGKSGAEKLCSIFSFSATFFKDEETLSMLSDRKDLIAFVCNLVDRDGKIVGQGRGIDTLVRNQNDANKAAKMAQKRGFIDATIRATGLSDIFTQDLESSSNFMSGNQVDDNQEWVNDIFREEKAENSDQFIEPITTKQRDYILSLLNNKNLSPEEKAEYLERADESSKQEASELIKELISFN